MNRNHSLRLRKRLLLFAAAVLPVFGPLSAEAQDVPNREFRHAVITLRNGETVDGYLRSDRGPRPSHMTAKMANYKIGIVSDPGSEKVSEYSVDQIESLVYTEPSNRYPEGERWEVKHYALPTVYKQGKSFPVLMCVENRSPGGTIYRYRGLRAPEAGKTSATMRDGLCIQFKDIDVVYDYELWEQMLLGLKKKNPRLREALKKYYDKGPDHKEHRRELKESPSSLLQFCDAFFASEQKE